MQIVVNKLVVTSYQELIGTEALAGNKNNVNSTHSGKLSYKQINQILVNNQILKGVSTNFKLNISQRTALHLIWTRHLLEKTSRLGLK